MRTLDLETRKFKISDNFFQVGHYWAFVDVFHYLAFCSYFLFLQYVAKYVYWRLNLFTRQSLVEEWLAKSRKHQIIYGNPRHRLQSGTLGCSVLSLCCSRTSLTSLWSFLISVHVRFFPILVKYMSKLGNNESCIGVAMWMHVCSGCR